MSLERITELVEIDVFDKDGHIIVQEFDDIYRVQNAFEGLYEAEVVALGSLPYLRLYRPWRDDHISRGEE